MRSESKKGWDEAHFNILKWNLLFEEDKEHPLGEGTELEDSATEETVGI